MKFSILAMTVVLLAGPAVATADKLDDTFQNLKDAVGKKDATQVKTLVAQLNPMVKEVTAAPAPSDPDEKQIWTARIEYAKSITEYCEYALFATAIQSPPAVTVDLIATLEQQSPTSTYLDQAYLQYFVALNQTGAAAKIPGIAAKGLEHFPDNPDLLSVMMESTYGKQNDRALTYANRLVAALGKPKPENVSAAEWERKRSTSLGRAHWMAGVIYCSNGTYAPGDRELRAALPLIAGNTAMSGPALFYLGLANYKLGQMTNNKARMLEAVKFMQQSSVIPGTFADQARHNAIVIQAEADRMR
ncbi:MAG: hypothetical protein ACLQOO_28175 [Terriglobia bacterium]